MSDPVTSDVRGRAEAMLRQRGSVEAPPELDVQKLVEELLIHQIELELQNDELRRASEVAEAARRQYADLFQGAPVGYVILDEQGLVVQTNQTFSDLLGVEEACAGKPFSSFLDEADQAIFLARYRAIFKVPQGKQLEVRLRRPAGTASVHVRLDAALQPSRTSPASPPRLLLALTDVSPQRRAEEEKERLRAQFLQSQKMEAVGQLAGGVAHDFNNILAAMTLELEFLHDERGLPAEERAAGLKSLLDSCQRAAALTRQLLLFSRRQAMRVVRTDLVALVHGLSSLLQRLLGETVSLSVKAHGAALWVDGDVSMLEQVLMNLCVNARDAMPRGGNITLSLDEVQFDRAPHPGAHEGRFACLRVADHGTGMDDATLAHLFEPFFTTKGPGRGTGLGLSTVHGIVQQHRGWVDVQSERGKGSAFSVYVPLMPAPAPADLDGARLEAPAGRGERVLVVEDEAAVRRMVVACLGKAGYVVTEATTPWEALERAGKKVDFDVVVTDLVMPGGLSGLDLARELRQRKAGLPVLVISGYSGGVAEPLTAEVAFLAKPFDARALRAAVRSLLEVPMQPVPKG